ncbi:transcription factor bHLH130-like isoform X2 [Rhododendron vialii]|uniref:transcription factor bHLH130-like isoform X2 n=1 Tax=Rhododendron vialii TaxID=182163 RepID=UPI00265E179B|nr:transcription factor bHLH130-like isoform X2 [Rhododendron vialii]
MNNQDEYRNYQNNHNHSNQSNSNSGLLRFRSAPSSLLSNFNSVGTDYGEKSSSPENVMHDLEESKPFANGYCLSSSQLPPQYPRQSNTSSYGGVVGSNHLMRQSSSPAGIFSPQNGMLSQISELEDESVVRSDIKLGNGSREPQFFPFGSWSESSHFPENYSLMKRDLDYDGKLFACTQNGELEHRAHNLSPHLSLPKTAAEMERLLQFQDTVPCKVRAKRGCATHPRSIAERVRRTRISERMRKLQDLVPNMDKQTNTADMLDLAVEYIKDLQKQYKILNEYRANCKCSSIQKAFANLSA